MDDKRPGLPRPIRIAIGFLILDVLWVLVWLGMISSNLRLRLSGEESTSTLGLLLGVMAWLGLAVGSAAGLRRRSRTALTAALFLTAASAAFFIVMLSLSLETLRRTQGLVVLGIVGSFLAPFCLLLAGRRDCLKSE